MKKILVMVLALVMAISMLACASAAELKWASVHPPEQVVTQMMMRAIDEINEKAEGIHITGYPNGVLGGSSDEVYARRFDSFVVTDGRFTESEQSPSIGCKMVNGNVAFYPKALNDFLLEHRFPPAPDLMEGLGEDLDAFLEKLLKN